MSAFRALIHNHSRLVLVLLALALVVKAAVPAGFMFSAGGDRLLTVTICSDATGIPEQVQILIRGKKDPSGNHSKGGDKGQPCAFAGLGHPALGGVDPILLVATLAFILLVGLAPRDAPTHRDLPFLRPPPRGPPASA